ncbi:MAG: DUF6746 family protein [Pseudomonadota bacterium]
MKKVTMLSLLLFGLSCGTVIADDKPKHFKPLESKDLTAAVCNLNKYNKTLDEIVSASEQSVEDMVKVHELTYTLENAIIKIKEELDEIAANLEEVHLASEKIDKEGVTKYATLYQDQLSLLLQPKSCD